MTKLKARRGLATVLAAVILGVVTGTAQAGPIAPSTATVDVQIKDLMVLSSMADSTPSASSSFLSPEANALWTTKAGLTDFASAFKLDYQVNTSAVLNGFGTSHSSGTLVPVTSPSGFASGGYTAQSSQGSGVTFATGLASVPNPFTANISASTSAGAGNETIATANAFSSALQIDLKSAGDIRAMNGGSSVFDIELYMDVAKAAIDLFTGSVDAVARGEFGITASIIALGSGGEVNSFAQLEVVSDGDTFSNDFATDSAGLSNPFVALTVDAATTSKVIINLGVTSTARSVVPVPEPSGIIMGCIALMTGGGIFRLRRRNPTPVSE